MREALRDRRKAPPLRRHTAVARKRETLPQAQQQPTAAPCAAHAQYELDEEPDEAHSDKAKTSDAGNLDELWACSEARLPPQAALKAGSRRWAEPLNACALRRAEKVRNKPAAGRYVCLKLPTFCTPYRANGGACPAPAEKQATGR